MLHKNAHVNDDANLAYGNDGLTGYDSNTTFDLDNDSVCPFEGDEEDLFEEEEEEEEENEEEENEEEEKPAGDDDDDFEEEIKDPKAVLAKKKELARKYHKVKQELKDIKAAQAKEKDKKLKESNNWKEVAEEKEKELAEANKKIESFEGSMTTAKKIVAFKKELGISIDEKYEHLIPDDEIELDDDGRPSKAMVAKAVKRFRNRYPEIIAAASSSSGMPHSAPGDDANVPSYENWLKMPAIEKKKHMAAVMKAKREDRTGT